MEQIYIQERGPQGSEVYKAEGMTLSTIEGYGLTEHLATIDKSVIKGLRQPGLVELFKEYGDQQLGSLVKDAEKLGEDPTAIVYVINQDGVGVYAEEGTLRRLTPEQQPLSIDDITDFTTYFAHTLPVSEENAISLARLLNKRIVSEALQNGKVSVEGFKGWVDSYTLHPNKEGFKSGYHKRVSEAAKDFLLNMQVN